MSSDAAEAPEGNGGQGSETLGSLLRAARESRDLSIEKIADELRIEEHVLRSLEEDRLSDIKAAPVFVKGYIKQYGRLLNLDYEELREAYRRQADTDDIRLLPNRAIYLRDERQIMIWVIAALAVLLVAVALLVWWLSAEDGAILESFGAADTSESVSVAAPLNSRARPSRLADDPPDVADSARTSAPEPAREPAPEPEPAVGGPALQAAAELPAAEVAVADATAAQQQIGLANAALSDADAPAFEPEPGSVPMSFVFAEESWFELTDARGRRLHYDLAEAGSELSFMALPPARVLLGNAAAVSITVAAEEFGVPNSGRRGNVAIFDIDPAQD